MARYRAIGAWKTDRSFAVTNNRFEEARFSIEYADALDTRTEEIYPMGAVRVRCNGRAAKRGKGGTVPFIGETAWHAAERLARELADEFRSSRAA